MKPLIVVETPQDNKNMIEPRYLNLRGLFTDRVFRIPKYQRFYSWTKKQREDLFQDITRLHQRKSDDHHFMATIVCFRTPERKTIGSVEYRMYDVVDGQQRLTTLIILLKCIEKILTDTKTDQDELAELAKLLVKKDSNLVLLQSNNPNQHIFSQFIKQGKKSKRKDLETEADKRLSSAIEECIEFTEGWHESGKDILDLLRIIQNRLGFVVYDTENAKLVYSLFEVLNSRGLEVDWLDKCKSMLMGAAHELAKSEPAARSATNALQSVWTKVYKKLAEINLSGQEILRVTATLKHGPSKGKPQAKEEALELLRADCKNISDPEQISLRLLEVAEMLVELEKDKVLGPATNILQARILAVAIKSAEFLDESQVENALKQWEIVTFRIFGLFGKDARTKVGEYIRVAEKIVNGSQGGSSYGELMASLRELGSDYPARDAAEEWVRERNAYERPETVRYVLWRYEEHLANKLGKNATVDPSEREKIWKLRAIDTIEHIYPQNPEWEGPWEWQMKDKRGKRQYMSVHCNRIGNLVLLPQALNSEARRDGFLQKKEVFKRHHLRQIDEIVKKRKWSLTDVENREAAIVSWAKKEWADLTD